jgi:alginate O-acetyltransferase complex protein AlgI
MVFSSTDFLLKFLPLFLAAYYIVPSRFRTAAICLGSLAFYCVGCFEEPPAILLLLLTTAVNYLLALVLERGEHKKTVLTIGLIWNVGILVFFKYSPFIFETLAKAVPALAAAGDFYLELPLGISFYSFCLVSYLTDVYRGDTRAEKNVLKFCAYVLYFPKLTSGPITRYEDLRERLDAPKIRRSYIEEGIRLFVFGLCFKVFLANQLGNLWNDIKAIGYDSVSTPLAWMGIFAYSFQLYFDFWGYSLMAMGLARLMGMRLPRNFDSPYMAVSMTEFWRRWHISLGSWFRDYVYIPLGGNREGRGRTVFNLLVVWLLTGIWHGAARNFVLWGLALFAILTAERLGLKDKLDAHRGLGHLYMALLIPLTWMIFAISRMKQLGVYAGRLIGIGAVNVMPGDWKLHGKTYWWLLLLGLLMSTGLPMNIYHRYRKEKWFWLLTAACAALSGYCIYKGSNDPFMYFRF